MIARDFRGAGFRGALNYVLSPEHDPRLIGRNLLTGDTPRALAHQVGLVRAQRPDVEKPVHHIALSFALEDRRLAPEELEAIGRRYMEAIGYGDSQYVMVEHRDRAHQHLHIVANRVRYDATLVRYQYRDWEVAMRALRAIERDYGLRVVEREPSRGLKQPPPGEYRLEAEHAVTTDRARLQDLVEDAWKGRPSLTEFLDRLEDLGVGARIYRNGAGELSGISYALGERHFGGFALGPSYTWRGLQREGVSYDPVRDAGAVERHVGGARDTWEDRLKAAAPAQDVERARLIVQAAVADRPSLTEFVGRLDALGVRVQFNVAKTGHVSGVTYHLDGHAFKGSQLGREFSWEGIRKQGVSYDPERDRAAVQSGDRAVQPRDPSPSARLEGRGAEVRRAEALVRGATADRPTLTEFVARLEAAGVQVRLYRNDGGDVFSVGYRIDGTYVRARDLGPEFSWDEMQRWHVRYDREAERATVRRIGTTFEAGPKRGGRRRKPTAEDAAALAERVVRAKQDRPTLSDFVERLGRDGVEVRLFTVEGRVASVGYVRGDVFVRGRDLGPGHSWQRLHRESLTPDPERDAAVVARLAVPVKGREAALKASPDDIAAVRALVDEAAGGLPPLREFVDRLREVGIEVRVLADREGRALGVAYAFGGVSIPDRELGPGYSWRRLGLSLSPDPSDPQVLARIVTTVDRSALGPERRPPSAEQLAHVRAIVEGATADAPSFTDFVQRVEAAGVEVRLFASADGKAVAIGYRVGEASVRGAELGPGHSWPRLERTLAIDPGRDRLALATVLVPLEGPGGRREPAPAEVARVRLVVEGATSDRPSLTEFVRRVEAAGVEVRLYADPHGRPTAIAYGLGDASIKGTELGPGHSWRRLEREAVSLDYRRDAEALAKVTTVLSGATPRVAPRQPTPEDLAQVRRVLDAARMGRPTLTEYVRRAEALGVEVRLYQDPRGRVSGVGYSLGDVPVKARDLGPDYGWKELSRAHVVYHAVRDRKAVAARATTVDEPRRGTLGSVVHAYHVGREAVEWVRRPHRQLVRVAGRLVSRAVAEVVKEMAHAAARRRDQRNAEAWNGVRLEPGRTGASRSRSSAALAPSAERASRGERRAEQLLASLAGRTAGIAERSSRPLDPRVGEAVARLRHYAGRAARDSVTTPARMVRRGR